MTDSAQPIKDGDFDRSKPINDARLEALEELSALDQKLELEYGLTGNPMIKAQQRMAAKQGASEPRIGAVRGPDPDSRVWETQGHTPDSQTTPSECSTRGTCSVLDSGIANEPVAWWLRGTEYDTGCAYEYVSLLRENAEAAAAEGGTVVPLYRSPTLTDAEREAVWGVATGMEKNGFPGYAAVIRILLERLRPTAPDATQEGGRA